MVVEANDLSKRFGRHWALARVSVQVAPGQALLLTGHNGSGKTTLLRLLATALSPSVGELRVLGHDARTEREAIRRRVGLLSHANFHYEDLTAEQNLTLLARLLSLPNPRAAAEAMLERVGLRGRAHHPVREFSAGMRKRLAIARVLLKKPDLVLLDEPFGELDPAGIADMERFIGELKASHTALVLATHLIEHGRALCDSRLHLAEGQAGAA